MFCCSAGRRSFKRFEQADADFIFGGETQLWPEIRKYFDMEDENSLKER